MNHPPPGAESPWSHLSLSIAFLCLPKPGPKIDYFFRRFFLEMGFLGSYFLMKSPEIIKNKVWKTVLFWELFLDRFWIGFSWKMKAFWKAAEAIIYYKNSSFSVFSVFASKTAPGPPRDQFWPPECAPFSNKNLLLTLPGLVRRGSQNGSRF